MIKNRDFLNELIDENEVSLFFVDSPLQVLSAYDAQKFFSCNNPILVVSLSYDREENNNQINKTIETLKWDKVLYLSPLHKDKEKKEIRSKELEFLQHSVNHIAELNFFIGDFRAVWIHKIRIKVQPTKTYLLDDGAATVRVVNDYLNNRIYWPSSNKQQNSFTLFLEKSLLAIFSKKYHYKFFKPMDVFTSFNVENKNSSYEVFKNSFNALGKISNKKEVLKNNLYFFGSKYSEDKIVSEDYELEYLSNIVEYCKEKALVLTYIPHRDESKEKLKKVIALGIKIHYTNAPSELYFINTQQLPEMIGSGFSTVLNNLPKIFDFKEVLSFKLDLNQVNPNHFDKVNDVYSFYKEEDGISIIEI